MAYTSGALNLMVDSLADLVVELSLHDDDPSTDGSNELTGSGYARQTPTWGAAASGTATMSGTLTFSVPAGTVAYVGYWGTAGAGTFYGSDALDSPETYAGSGEFKLTSSKLGLSSA